MGVIEIFNKLENIKMDLFGELVLSPESDIIEWSYDGLLNPDIYNTEQLYEIYELDCDIIKSFLEEQMITLTINDPYIDNNTIFFEINE